MPRFTKEPGLMSRATRRARSSRPSGLSAVWMPAVRPAWSLDWTLISGHAFCLACGCSSAGINPDDAVDVDSGGHDDLRVQAAGGDDLGHLDNGVFGRGGHDR